MTTDRTNIYLVSRTDQIHYDEYAAMVVYADSEDEAKDMFRRVECCDSNTPLVAKTEEQYISAGLSLDRVLEVRCLAIEVVRVMPSSLICSDFNAG